MDCGLVLGYVLLGVLFVFVNDFLKWWIFYEESFYFWGRELIVFDFVNDRI